MRSTLSGVVRLWARAGEVTGIHDLRGASHRSIGARAGTEQAGKHEERGEESFHGERRMEESTDTRAVF